MVSRGVAGRTQYALAASLDGFLAEADDGLAWLYAYDSDAMDRVQREFLAGVGAIAVGARTYDVILRNHPGQWAYGRLPTWVFTHRAFERPASPDADVRFVARSVSDVYPELVQAAGERNVWVLGGGDLAGQFVDAGLLDELLVTLAPDVLGSGIPFLPRRLLKSLRLAGTRSWPNGMVELRYDVRGSRAGR